jgi:hypothetical protein
MLLGALALLALATISTRVLTPAPDTDRPALTRHSVRVHKTIPPAQATADPNRHDQSGSSESNGSHGGPAPIVEHHEIHTSGSVAVVSGTVDPGTGGNDAHGSRFGPPITRHPHS